MILTGLCVYSLHITESYRNTHDCPQSRTIAGRSFSWRRRWEENPILLLERTESTEEMALGSNELKMSLLHQAKKLMGFSC